MKYYLVTSGHPNLPGETITHSRHYSRQAAVRSLQAILRAIRSRYGSSSYLSGLTIREVNGTMAGFLAQEVSR